MRCRWGDGWRTQERGVNRQGADRLGKHREQSRADEANTGQVWRGRTGQGRSAGTHSRENTEEQTENQNPTVQE